jgi:hypothetical protein
MTLTENLADAEVDGYLQIHPLVPGTDGDEPAQSTEYDIWGIQILCERIFTDACR